MAALQRLPTRSGPTGHRHWVRISHWIVTVSFLTLAVTGVAILMVQPRLYWGEVGNDLTPALIELPISRNYKHNGWDAGTPFFDGEGSPVTANRTYDIFNQNGWGRSLHFLAGWFLVLSGAIYMLGGIFTSHFGRHIVPGRIELAPGSVWSDVKDHLRLRIPAATGGPDYGPLQKFAYLSIVFLALPLMVISGLTMSPAITAAFPFLLDLFGGHQSARTIHFFAFVALILFLLVHILMIVKSGFRRQMRAMTIGGKHEE
ncbi:MAG: cytochrome b/b6 domain-containing protein [Acidobacteriota bacterium]